MNNKFPYKYPVLLPASIFTIYRIQKCPPAGVTGRKQRGIGKIVKKILYMDLFDGRPISLIPVKAFNTHGHYLYSLPWRQLEKRIHSTHKSSFATY
ncbi:MAG: hypothetical protein JW770_01580 [Actinobacteria bacterium]|nr:hypothetical protein [Actinomycetota bacterium]